MSRHRADIGRCVMCTAPATQTQAAPIYRGVRDLAAPVCDKHAAHLHLVGNVRTVWVDDGTYYDEEPTGRHLLTEPITAADYAAHEARTARNLDAAADLSAEQQAWDDRGPS